MNKYSQVIFSKFLVFLFEKLWYDLLYYAYNIIFLGFSFNFDGIIDLNEIFNKV